MKNVSGELAIIQMLLLLILLNQCSTKDKDIYWTLKSIEGTLQNIDISTHSTKLDISSINSKTDYK